MKHRRLPIRVDEDRHNRALRCTMFHVEHSPQRSLAGNSGATGPARIEGAVTNELDEARPLGPSRASHAQVEAAKFRVRPPRLSALRWLADDESTARTKEAHGTFRRNRGRTEAPGNHEAERFALGRIMRQYLRPALEDHDTVDEIETLHGTDKELRPTMHSVEQDQRLARPAFCKDQAGDPSTCAEVENRALDAADELSHCPGMDDVVGNGSGSEKPELAGVAQHVEESRVPTLAMLDVSTAHGRADSPR